MVRRFATWQWLNGQEFDPDFQFDIYETANDSTSLISATSDSFFKSDSFSPPYDIVFIDGLHIFEQVVRDLSNAVLRSHRRSIILLDDTLPNDVYSTLTDYTATFRHRSAAGDDNQSWHGDVFKIIFYIHDFWPGLDYRTIIGSGNAQTLVWRGNSSQRQPLFNNLERISRLTYFDLQDHIAVMQSSLEEEAIAACIKDLAV